MRFLISIVDSSEAASLDPASCDILDVKDPSEGTIGAASPQTIQAITLAMDKRLPLSVSVGDAHRNPNTMALAFLGAAAFKPQYIKVGLLGVPSLTEAAQVMVRAVETVRHFRIDAQIVVVGYADHRAAGCVNPLELPPIAAECGVQLCMIDTVTKDRRTPFQHFTREQLAGFVEACRERGLGSCLSGGLDEASVPDVLSIGPDIMGMRGGVCVGKSRESRLEPTSVRKIYQLVHAST